MKNVKKYNTFSRAVYNVLCGSVCVCFQAHVISERGEDMICIGQHHVTIEKADNIYTSYPFVLVSRLKDC